EVAPAAGRSRCDNSPLQQQASARFQPELAQGVCAPSAACGRHVCYVEERSRQLHRQDAHNEYHAKERSGEWAHDCGDTERRGRHGAGWTAIFLLASTGDDRRIFHRHSRARRSGRYGVEHSIGSDRRRGRAAGAVHSYVGARRSVIRMHTEGRFRATNTITRLATGAILCAAALIPITAASQVTTQSPAALPAPAPAPSPPSADAVLPPLPETVSLYRPIETIAQNSDLSDGTRTRDGMRSSALVALRSAFDFARAAARMVDAAPHSGVPNASTSDTSDDAVRLDRAATRIGARIDTIQKRIAA